MGRNTKEKYTDANARYKLKVIGINSHYNVFIDNNLVLENIVDNSYLCGSIGIRTFNAHANYYSLTIKNLLQYNNESITTKTVYVDDEQLLVSKILFYGLIGFAGLCSIITLLIILICCFCKVHDSVQSQQQRTSTSIKTVQEATVAENTKRQSINKWKSTKMTKDKHLNDDLFGGEGLIITK